MSKFLGPICVKCHMPYRPHRNGVLVVEYVNDKPYSLTGADIWKCPMCGHEVVCGFAEKSLEHWDERFDSVLATTPDSLKVPCYHRLSEAEKEA